MKTKNLLQLDKKRYANEKMPLWQIFWRKSQISKFKILKIFYKAICSVLKKSKGIEISSLLDCGPGVYFGHDYCITINPGTKLGRNINIHKGVTIGRENRGPRKGVPTIGNNVWIGINSTIVGKITIGDDVLIAPNSFVNKDIPAHSVVVGNPCSIHHKENATEGYINNKV